MPLTKCDLGRGPNWHVMAERLDGSTYILVSYPKRQRRQAMAARKRFETYLEDVRRVWLETDSPVNASHW